MTIIEKARMLRKIIEKLSAHLSDLEALEAVELFEQWDGNGHEYTVDDRFRYNNKLYKVIQAHTSQSHYTPDITPALCTEIAEQGQGTIENPIPYNNNMELEEGKYYSQNNVIYYCFRSTGIAVYNNLADLVNLYVNVVS